MLTSYATCHHLSPVNTGPSALGLKLKIKGHEHPFFLFIFFCLSTALQYLRFEQLENTFNVQFMRAAATISIMRLWKTHFMTKFYF